MNIIRQIQPKGAPFIVDAETDDEGNILKDTVRVYPIIPSDPPRIGECIPLNVVDKTREGASFLFIKPKKDNETN